MGLFSRFRKNKDKDIGIFRGDLDQVRTVAEQSEPESEPKADGVRGAAAIIEAAREEIEREEALRIMRARQSEPESELKADTTRGAAEIIRRISLMRQRVEADAMAAMGRGEGLEDMLDGETIEWDGVRRRVSWSGGIRRIPDLGGNIEDELSPVRRRRSMSVDEAMRQQIYNEAGVEVEEIHPQSLVYRVRNLFVPRSRSTSNLLGEKSGLAGPASLEPTKYYPGDLSAIQKAPQAPHSAYSTDSRLRPENTDPHLLRRQFSFQSTPGRHSRSDSWDGHGESSNVPQIQPHAVPQLPHPDPPAKLRRFRGGSLTQVSAGAVMTEEEMLGLVKRDSRTHDKGPIISVSDYAHPFYQVGSSKGSLDIQSHLDPPPPPSDESEDTRWGISRATPYIPDSPQSGSETDESEDTKWGISGATMHITGAGSSKKSPDVPNIQSYPDQYQPSPERDESEDTRWGISRATAHITGAGSSKKSLDVPDIQSYPYAPQPSARSSPQVDANLLPEAFASRETEYTITPPQPPRSAPGYMYIPQPPAPHSAYSTDSGLRPENPSPNTAQFSFQSVFGRHPRSHSRDRDDESSNIPQIQPYAGPHHLDAEPPPQMSATPSPPDFTVRDFAPGLPPPLSESTTIEESESTAIPLQSPQPSIDDSPAIQSLTIPTPQYSPRSTDSGLGLEGTDPTGVQKQLGLHSRDSNDEESDAVADHLVTQPNQRLQKSMAASLQNFEDYKLETDFQDGCVVHKTHKWELSTRLWEKSTWRQHEKIGSGAFGSVWLQKKQEGGQLRAVKILLRDSLPKAGFSQELLALVKLKDHERFFVKFFGWYENSDHIFLVMEYIEHGDLQKYMLKDPQKAKTEAKEITRQILKGLEILHKKEICHRDLKPPNILIASPNPIWVKIADFGVAKRTKNTTARTAWGTEGYRAPEQLGALPRGLSTKKFPAALDIWSLGSLVHELLTSQVPFTNTDDESGSETGVVVESEGGIDLGTLVDYCYSKIEFPAEVLQKSQVGEEGIAFIKNLLIPNPRHRPSATRVLQHSWLQEHTRD